MKLKKAIAIFLGITLSYPTLPVLEKTKIIAEENNVQRLEKDSIKEMETAEEKAVTDFSQYEENELLVLYKDGTSKKEKKKIVNEIETTMQERETITDWADLIILLAVPENNANEFESMIIELYSLISNTEIIKTIKNAVHVDELL